LDVGEYPTAIGDIFFYCLCFMMTEAGKMRLVEKGE
jgi:hypothetical protein